MPRRFAAMLALPWVADGVSDDEREAAQMLVVAAILYPDTFHALLEKPWLRDEITLAETGAVFGIRWASRYNPDLATRMLQLPWVQDAITVDEANVIQHLHWLTWYRNEPTPGVLEAAYQILEMPFLESVGGADAAAVWSLEKIEDIDTQRFLQVMSHQNISDGITDAETKIIALLGGTHTHQPELVDPLLQGNHVYLEERTIRLDRSGEVLLAVIRSQDRTTPSMDYLEHSVRTLEEFLGEPLPTNYIALFFGEVGAATFAAGTNYGTHVAMQSQFDGKDSAAPSVIAHEVSHYYWSNSSRGWIDEGIAEFLALISEHARTGAPIASKNRPCSSATTIAELEAIGVAQISREALCFYSLGESLFLELYHVLGDEPFRQALRSLYRKRLRDDYSDDCHGTDLNVCHVAAAFKDGVDDAIAARVDEALDRWYGPRP